MNFFGLYFWKAASQCALLNTLYKYNWNNKLKFPEILYNEFFHTHVQMVRILFCFFPINCSSLLIIMRFFKYRFLGDVQAYSDIKSFSRAQPLSSLFYACPLEPSGCVHHEVFPTHRRVSNVEKYIQERKKRGLAKTWQNSYF